MDSHTHSVQRLEIVETGRRRRWSDDEKRRIVAESLDGPREGSATARRYGISRGLLFTWRRMFGMQLKSSDAKAATHFASVRVIPDTPAVVRPRGRIEIALARGTRIVVDADVDADALARVLDVLERR